MTGKRLIFVETVTSESTFGTKKRLDCHVTFMFVAKQSEEKPNIF